MISNAPGLAADSNGNLLIAGTTFGWAFYEAGLTITSNAIKKTTESTDIDGVIILVNPTGAITYSSFFGGESYDLVYGATFDSAGNIIVVGVTQSDDFPTMNPISGSTNHACFVSKLTNDGTAITFSSKFGGVGYYGSSYEWADSVATDSANNIYVVGVTKSTNFVPPPSNVITNNTAIHSFQVTFSPTGSVVSSSYLAAAGTDFLNAVTVTSSTPTQVFYTGWTSSYNFPVNGPPTKSSGTSGPANGGIVVLSTNNLGFSGGVIASSSSSGSASSGSSSGDTSSKNVLQINSAFGIVVNTFLVAILFAFALF